MPDQKSLTISVITDTSKAKPGNFQPINIHLNIYQNHDGKRISTLGLSNFEPDSYDRQFFAIKTPFSSFAYELGTITAQRTSNLFSGNLKPKKKVVHNVAAKRNSGSSLKQGWQPGIYIFFIGIEMAPSDIRPDITRGSAIFQFEIK